MQTPFISIIIPTLNEEKFLPNLLKSLSIQTSKDFEVIVVDGQSIDKTIAKAKSFAKTLPHLEVIVAEKASLPYQRNVGARAARGSWLAFIDADSVMMSYFIERTEQFIQKKKPVLFTSWCSVDSEISKDALISLLANMMLEGGIIFKRPIAPGPLAIVHRDIFERVHGYDETRGWGEDQDFSSRVFELGYEIDMLRETLYKFSLRRVRKEGALKFFRTYTLGILWTLISRRAPKNMPGYIMGGHLYNKDQKSIEPSRLKQYEVKLKNLIREFFE